MKLRIFKALILHLVRICTIVEDKSISENGIVKKKNRRK